MQHENVMRRQKVFLILVILTLYSCTPSLSPSQVTPSHKPINLPTITPTPPPTPTQTAIPTITLTPTETPKPVFIDATVWTSDPQVPILVYHRFYQDFHSSSTNTKIRLSDFKNSIQSLYDAGYTLVSLERWLKGDMRMPAGRRPLIITIDDLFFADQISLNEDGTPTQNSGIGILWQFYQDHPDFRFDLSLFYNLGDKHYGNVKVGDWWQKGPGWEDSLANVIAWCIEHQALPYNHLFTHPMLSLIKNTREFKYQAEENEKSLREFLARIGKENLADDLDNIISIPYGDWPTNPEVMRALQNYVSTNGKPLLGIMDVDYAVRAKYLQPVYSPDFDRLKIPRIVANADAIHLLVQDKEKFAVSQNCLLGPVDTNKLSDQNYIMQIIATAGSTSLCPDGVYALEQGLFRMQNGIVSSISVVVP